MGKERKKTTLTKVAHFLYPPLASLTRELEQARKAADQAAQATQAAKARVDALQKEQVQTKNDAKNQIDQLNEAKSSAEKLVAEQQAYIARLLQSQNNTESEGSGKPRIGILSGYYPNTRFNSTANHRLYADQHGYNYIFDSIPRYDTRAYMRKLEAVLEYLELFDWLFWIDDDAYFTDFSIRLESFIEQAPNADFIACKSPSTKTIFTLISSGQLLIKNTELAKSFISDALKVDLSEVKKWWRPELGMYTGGDQDALVYLMKTNPSYAPSFFASILDHQQFNNRPFEYEASLEEHFVVHFTGKQKALDKARFCQRLGCNEYLCPPALLDTLAIR